MDVITAIKVAKLCTNLITATRALLASAILLCTAVSAATEQSTKYIFGC